jgi:intracellular sulfur oxidation DsrE/DsrF family protein
MLKYLYSLLAVAFLSIPLAHAQDVKAVYHISTGVESAAGAMNNIQNHLNADPKAKIVVVALGAGIDFLLQDATDSKGREFSAAVSDLAGRGVEFRVCNNTLVSRNINPDRLLMETRMVPSGVAEVARLQAREGFAYLKP